MFRSIATLLGAFLLALLILLVSTFRSASIRYAFNQDVPEGSISHNELVDYPLPYPGRISPGSPIWPLKAARDKIRLALTIGKVNKANYLLHLADKRLAASKMLFENGEPEIALSTLTKAEKYLERSVMAEQQARIKGEQTAELLGRISLSTLKHREVIEEDLFFKVPEDARPQVNETANYSRRLYNETKSSLSQIGRDAPIANFKD